MSHVWPTPAMATLVSHFGLTLIDSSLADLLLISAGPILPPILPASHCLVVEVARIFPVSHRLVVEVSLEVARGLRFVVLVLP